MSEKTVVHPTKKVIKNCCPHTVTIYTGSIYDPLSGTNKGGRPILRVKPCGILATATSSVSAKPDLILNDIFVPTCCRVFTKITPLPKEENTLYIVSSLYAQAAKELGVDCSNLLVPYGSVVNEHGQTIGCTGLVRCG